jgi:plasmid stabilization system protein ParE
VTLPVRFSPIALQDFEDIWNYIARDSLDAANRVESAILDACHYLAAHPLSGTRRDEITSASVRFWTVSRYPNYIVVYRPHTNPVEIVSVLHGKRDLPSALR